LTKETMGCLTSPRRLGRVAFKIPAILELWLPLRPMRGDLCQPQLHDRRETNGGWQA
jgi:hypothetical protein